MGDHPIEIEFQVGVGQGQVAFEEFGDLQGLGLASIIDVHELGEKCGLDIVTELARALKTDFLHLQLIILASILQGNLVNLHKLRPRIANPMLVKGHDAIRIDQEPKYISLYCSSISPGFVP